MNLRDCLPPFDEEAARKADAAAQERWAKRRTAPDDPQDHRQEGIDAYLRGEDFESCEFADGDDKSAWQQGWLEAEADDEEGDDD